MIKNFENLPSIVEIKKDINTVEKFTIKDDTTVSVKKGNNEYV